MKMNGIASFLLGVIAGLGFFAVVSIMEDANDKFFLGITTAIMIDAVAFGIYFIGCDG